MRLHRRLRPRRRPPLRRRPHRSGFSSSGHRRRSFAGYFAADKQGYFKDENLTVEILPGGPDVVPQQVGSAPDGPEFTISWVPKVLEAREKGSDLVDIAQIFQRSGTLEVTWKKDKITDICQLAGKKVGTWGFGNEFEVTAGLANNCGLKPGLENGGDKTTQYQQVTQNFDMVAFLNHELTGAEAMIYNEYAQVLEATNPETGKQYSPDDLVIYNWNDQRSAMLQDAIWARKSWLDKAGQPGRGHAVRPGFPQGLDVLPRPPGRLRPVHDRCR